MNLYLMRNVSQRSLVNTIVQQDIVSPNNLNVRKSSVTCSLSQWAFLKLELSAGHAAARRAPLLAPPERAQWPTCLFAVGCLHQ